MARSAAYSRLPAPLVVVPVSPAINSDGTRIAFNSFKDITGGNADLNTEIFLCASPTPGAPGTRVYIDPYKNSTPYTPGAPAP